MRVLVVDSEAEIFKACSKLDKNDFEITNCSSVIAAVALAEEVKPKIILVNVSLRGAFDFVKWVKGRTGAQIVLLSPRPFLRGMETWGADAHLRKPFTSDELERKLRQIADEPVGEEGFKAKVQKRSSQSHKIIPQEVVSIWGAKGGAGRTLIAAHLAHYLQSLKVILIDLNFAQGLSDLSVYLSLPRIPHLGKFLDIPTNRREGFLASLIKTQKSHFSVVQPPPTLDQAEKITSEDIVDLLDQARRLFNIVLIDLPSSVNSITLEAVDLSTTVLLVTPPYYGSIGRLAELRDFLNKGSNRGLVVNRYIGGSPTPREIAHYLDIPLVTVIREDPLLERKVNTGEFLTDADSHFYEGIGKIASNLFKIERERQRRRLSLMEIFRNREVC